MAEPQPGAEQVTCRILGALAGGCAVVTLGGAIMWSLTGDQEWASPELGNIAAALFFAWAYLLATSRRQHGGRP